MAAWSLPLLLFLFFQAAVGWRFDATGLDEQDYSFAVSSKPHSPHSSRNASDPAPLTFFEVSRPIPVTNPPCAQIKLLDYSFGNTISSPPVVVPYNPPKCEQGWGKAVLRWNVTSRGRQFDRIAAVWLNGVEIFRTSTAEPTKQGIVWEVEKDISAYRALLVNPSQDLAVSLGNVIDKTYTGFFNVSLTIDFYSSSGSRNSAADLILPIAMPTSQNGGYWFQIQNDSDTRSVKLSNLPRNIYKAKLEVYISFHGDDEFWYTNPTNDYLQANNLTKVQPGNGPYRQVLAMLGDRVVGEICPFPVIFTGGINPLMWRPAAAIGAFNLPTYTLDLTPFVGQMVDGNTHSFSLSVTNAIRFWLLDANLHLWLDDVAAQTAGQLTAYSSSPADMTYDSHYKGLDGSLRVSASRSLSYSGYVVSSLGNRSASSSYDYEFDNRMDFSHNGSVSVVKQQIQTQTKFVVTRSDSKDVVALDQISSSYPLEIYSSQADAGNKTVILESKISHGFEGELQSHRNESADDDDDDDNHFFSRLDNHQKTEGKIWIANGNTVTKGTGELKQNYALESTQGCYYRKIKTSNTTKLFDQVDTSCIARS